MTNYDWYFVLLLIVVVAVHAQFRIHLAVVTAIGLYGLALLQGRLIYGLFAGVRFLFRKRQTVQQAILPAPMPEPESVLEFPAYYKLRPGQVVFGLTSRKKALIFDLGEGHTLLAGITGSGKTVSIHNILLQCYAMGERFWGNFEVYLLDLKGHQKDMLHRWRPLLDGFADINEPEQVIALLKLIDQKTHSGSGKRILIIIDEVVNITKFASDKDAGRILEKLATQFRTTGNLIVTTQSPRFDVIDTIIRHNLERRICFLVRELAHIRGAMAKRTLKEKDVPRLKGEFLALDSGSGQLLRGRVPMPDIYDTPRKSGEISQLIERSLIAQAEDDPRLRLFVAVAQDKKKGGQLPGIVRLAKEVDWLKQKDIEYFYRNYRLAEATKLGAGPNNKAYYLTCDFEEAYSMIRRYISLEQWHDEPPKASDE